jgi:hypothetical protein
MQGKGHPVCTYVAPYGQHHGKGHEGTGGDIMTELQGWIAIIELAILCIIALVGRIR